MTVHLSRRYVFFAAHRLHAPTLSDAENQALYGKCNNPNGHGHNYEVEVTVGGQVNPVTGRAVDLHLLDELCERQILAPFRYRNLNTEVEEFRHGNPTTENLATVVEVRLRSVWLNWFPAGGPRLEKIRIWETDRNICEVCP
jgi:6-pyruvoyltetrahydropterin/6-carboxytetrahydropterin synthase